MQLRIITKEELLKLYKDDPGICHQISKEKGFRALKTPYFTDSMYKYLGTETTITAEEVAREENYCYRGWWWDRDWLIPIGIETITINKDMALKLI